LTLFATFAWLVTPTQFSSSTLVYAPSEGARIIHAFRSFDKYEGKWRPGGLPSSRFVFSGFKAVSPFSLASWPSFSCLVRGTLFLNREQNWVSRCAGSEFHASTFARLG
jgi:hypothetical protein